MGTSKMTSAGIGTTPAAHDRGFTAQPSTVSKDHNQCGVDISTGGRNRETHELHEKVMGARASARLSVHQTESFETSGPHSSWKLKRRERRAPLRGTTGSAVQRSAGVPACGLKRRPAASFGTRTGTVREPAAGTAALLYRQHAQGKTAPEPAGAIGGAIGGTVGGGCCLAGP